MNKNRKIKNYNKDSTRQNKGDTPIFSTIKESFRNFDQFEEEFECLTYKHEEKTKFEKLYEQDRREYSSKQSNNKPRDQLLFNDMKNKLENIIIDKEDNLKIYKDNLINNKNLINYNNNCGYTTKNNKSVKIRNNNRIVNDKKKLNNKRNSTKLIYKKPSFKETQKNNFSKISRITNTKLKNDTKFNEKLPNDIKAMIFNENKLHAYRNIYSITDKNNLVSSFENNIKEIQYNNATHLMNKNLKVNNFQTNKLKVYQSIRKNSIQICKNDISNQKLSQFKIFDKENAYTNRGIKSFMYENINNNDYKIVEQNKYLGNNYTNLLFNKKEYILNNGRIKYKDEDTNTTINNIKNSFGFIDDSNLLLNNVVHKYVSRYSNKKN